VATLIHAAGVLAAVREVVPARAQMATTLGFHIILACFGIALPTVVLVAEYLGLKRSDDVAMTLARRWSQALGVLVAVGAVTGTVLSFEMGLLWPGLMRTYGGVIGLPFSVEGIFVGIYLYGWRRLEGWAHFWSGVPVAVSGILGAISVMAANSWMNQPGGFTMRAGRVVAVEPWAVIFNRAAAYEMPHMVLAAYMVVGFGVASVYAVGFLRGRRDRYHRLGFRIPFVLAAVLTPIQIFIGDTAARAIATDQPVKLGLAIPDMDSLLVGFSPHTKVLGWDSVARADRPPAPTLIHLSFDAMVGLAFLLLLTALWALVVWRRRRALPERRLFWWLAAACGPAALAAMECGWIVTEVGRQPWVVYRLLTTAQAATTNRGVIASLTGVIVLYAVLGLATILILRMLARRWREGDEGESSVPYGPPTRRPPTPLAGEGA
jgi:cytochrome d ubiquinol oxidase subunit I